MGRVTPWLFALCVACARGSGAGGGAGGDGVPAFSIAYPDADGATAKLGKPFHAKPTAQCFYDNGREARWTTGGVRVAAGELPPGMTLEDGVIGGVPTKAGSYSATLELGNVTCAGKPHGSQSIDVRITVK